MATNIQDLLDKLPDELRPLVDKWINLILTMTDEEVTKLSIYLLSGDNMAAYELAVSKMSGSELVAAMKETNARIKAHTNKALSQSALQRQILLEIIQVLWMMATLWARKEIIPPPPA